METISQSFLTAAILRLSCDMILEPGKECCVFDMPIPMFDLRASSALAGLTHKEKILSLCSLDRHHTAPGQQREPDPNLHNAEKPIHHPTVFGAATRTGLGLRDGVRCKCVVGKPCTICLSNIRFQTYSLWQCLRLWSLNQSSETCLCCANPPTACRDKKKKLVTRKIGLGLIGVSPFFVNILSLGERAEGYESFRSDSR